MIRESRFMCCIWDSYVFNFILLSSLFLIVNKFCNYRYHLFLYSSFDSKKLTNKNKYPRNTRKYWNWNLNLTDNVYKLISIMRKSRFIESSCEREVPILIGDKRSTRFARVKSFGVTTMRWYNNYDNFMWIITGCNTALSYYI